MQGIKHKKLLGLGVVLFLSVPFLLVDYGVGLYSIIVLVLLADFLIVFGFGLGDVKNGKK